MSNGLRPPDDFDDQNFENGPLAFEEEETPRARPQARRMPPQNNEARLFGLSYKVLYRSIIALVVLGCAVFVLLPALQQLLMPQTTPARPQMTRVGMPQEQPTAPAMTNEVQQFAPAQQQAFPPQSALAQMPNTPPIPANLQASSELQEIKAKLAEVLSRLDGMANRLEEVEKRTSNATIPNGQETSALQEGLARITNELRKSEEENQKLKVSNDSLSKQLEIAEAELARSRQVVAEFKKKKKADRKTDSPKEVAESGKDNPQSEQQPPSPSDANPNELDGIRVIGLWPGGAILSDQNGNTATVEVGQSFKGFRLETVDFAKGVVKTSKGQLLYR